MSRNGELPTDSVGEEDIVSPSRESLEQCLSARGSLTTYSKTTYDGDTASATIVYSDEAIAELDRYLDSTAAYLDPRGGFKAGCDIDTITLVLKNMTGD